MKNLVRITAFTICWFVTSGCVSTHGFRKQAQADAVAEPVKRSGEHLYRTILQAHYLSFAGQVHSARNTFDSILEKHAENPEVTFQLARFYIDLVYRAQDQKTAYELLNLAKNALEKTIQLNPGHLTAQKLIAEVYVELTDFPRAIQYMQKLILAEPGNQNIMIDLARIYVFSQEPQKAILLLEPLILQKDIQNYDIYKVYALACAEEGLYSRAIEAFQAYLEIFPEDFESTYNLALSLFRHGEVDSAADLLESLKESSRMTIEVAELYVDVLKAAGRFYDAIELLEVMRKNPLLEVSADIEIGRIYLNLENFEVAYKHLARAISKAPDDRHATFLAAIALGELGRFQEALNILEINLEESPVSVASADLASNLMLRTGQTDAAITLVERLVTERSKDVRSYLVASRVMEDLNRTQDSIEMLREGVIHFPDNFSVNLMLAYHLEKHGNWLEAIEIAEVMHEKWPDDPDIANFIGFVLADRNQQLSRAEALIQKALRAEPDNGAYLDSLAWVYYRLGRYDEALQKIREAYSLIPDDPVVIEHLIHICIALGKYDNAHNVLREALSRFPDHTGLLVCKKLLENADEN